MIGPPRAIGRRELFRLAVILTLNLLGMPLALGDGLVMAPREYKGSLEELAQEGILVFHPGDEKRGATEDLILKIRVRGDVESFAWIIPLPGEPTTAPEDPALFEELHRYVQARLAARSAHPGGGLKSAKAEAPIPAEGLVQVLSRQDVGSYDVAIVREKQPGALSTWLNDNGYRSPEKAEDIIGFYRKKGYVFACVRVRDAVKKRGMEASLHPLRFTFKTGGRDGIYFPMRLTGLQSEPFDVNLYVFYERWLNDRLSRFGFAHRGFSLIWRDFDGPKCDPNAGKSWTNPSADPYLRDYASIFPTVTSLFRKLHPGARYYLTNIRAGGLKAGDVRDWSDDLWLFPYYTDPRTIPFDARGSGPASSGFPQGPSVEVGPGSRLHSRWITPVVTFVLLAFVARIAYWRIIPTRAKRTPRDRGVADLA